MRTILFILLTLVSLQSIALPPDILSGKQDYYIAPIKLKMNHEDKNTGALYVVAGVMLTGIGIIKEYTREPYPNHSTSINYNPEAPQVLNYLLIGSGLGFTGYGIKLLIKF
jgi:hypothetical protein